jgi:hypothetical protein
MRNWLQVKKQSVPNKFIHITDETAKEQEESKHLETIYRNIKEKALFLIRLEPAKLIGH